MIKVIVEKIISLFDKALSIKKAELAYSITALLLSASFLVMTVAIVYLAVFS